MCKKGKLNVHDNYHINERQYIAQYNWKTQSKPEKIKPVLTRKIESRSNTTTIANKVKQVSATQRNYALDRAWWLLWSRSDQLWSSEVLSTSLADNSPVYHALKSTSFDDRLIVAKFSQSGVWDTVPEGITLIFADTWISLQHSVG